MSNDPFNFAKAIQLDHLTAEQLDQVSRILDGKPVRPTVTVNLSDEDLFTCIAGAGASSYCWYETFDPDWDGLKLTVSISLEDVQGSATLTPASLRTTIAALVEAGIAHPVNGVNWGDEECDSDVDADIADCVIQYALLGDVVFG